MGPVIILDKSSLQALSKKELVLLNKYFFVNIPPILPIEILGDLKKVKGEDVLNEEKVIEIANKLIQKDNAMTVHYQNLVISSLIGTDYITARRPIVGGGKRVIDKDGRKGLHITETQEAIALRNWQKGKFTEAEKLLAEQWRYFSKGYDLEEAKRNWKKYLSLIPTCHDFSELNKLVERVLTNNNMQNGLLADMMEIYQIEPKLASKIFYRWESGNYKLIKDFAPYAYYCLKINFVFPLGIVFGLITTRPTNIIDVQ